MPFFGAGAAIAATTTTVASSTVVAAVVTSAAISAAVAIGASFAFNALQPKPEIEIGKIEDTQRFTSEEGTPIMRCYGERCRVGGTVLWVGRLEETKKTFTEGGARITEFKYFRDIAVALCHGPIESVTRIFANGVTIWQNYPVGLEVIAPDFHVETGLTTILPGFSLPFLPDWIQFPDTTWGIMRIHQPILTAGDPDVRDFVCPGFMSFTGWSPGHPNSGFPLPGVTMKCVGGGTDISSEFVQKHIPGGSYYIDLINGFAVETHPPYGDPLTLTQEPGQIFDRRYTRTTTVHLGTEDQERDFLWSLRTDPNTLPAYRGIVYVFMEDLQLEDFGFQVPKLEFEVRESSNRNLGTTLQEMVKLAGLTEDDIEVDADLFDIQMRGTVIPGPTPMNKAIAPLLRAYNCAVQESNDGRLRFMKRHAGTVWTIKEVDLAAHEIGESVQRPLEVTDIPDDTLPEQVNIEYVDTSLNLKRGSQRERRINLTNRNVMKLQFPVTLDPGEARSVAARELWLSVINRQTVKLRLPPSYFRVKENDILKITADGNDYRVMVTRIERGNNWILMIEGFLESEDTQDFDIVGDSGIPQDDVGVPPLMLPIVIDKGGPIASPHAGFLGMYFAVVNISTAPFQPTNIWLLVDEVPLPDSPNILEVMQVQQESEWGIGVDTPDASARPGLWDYVSSVTVDMQRGGTLSSATESQVLGNHFNWAKLGNEIIAFQSAELITGTTRYKLTKLLRGLRDTEDEISGHVVQEIFLPLRGDQYEFFPQMPAELIGSQLYFGASPEGASAEEVVWADPMTYFGHSGKAFRSKSLAIVPFSTSGALVFSWSPMASQHYAPFSTPTEPLHLPPGAVYQIEIYVASVLVRTEFRTDPWWIYNSTDQIAEGSDSGFTVKLYDISSFGPSLATDGSYTP